MGAPFLHGVPLDGAEDQVFDKKPDDDHRQEAGEDFAWHRRGAVGDDEIGIGGGRDQALRIERRGAFVQPDLDQLLQPREGALRRSSGFFRLTLIVFSSLSRGRLARSRRKRPQ